MRPAVRVLWRMRFGSSIVPGPPPNRMAFRPLFWDKGPDVGYFGGTSKPDVHKYQDSGPIPKIASSYYIAPDTSNIPQDDVGTATIWAYRQ